MALLAGQTAMTVKQFIERINQVVPKNQQGKRMLSIQVTGTPGSGKPYKVLVGTGVTNTLLDFKEQP